MRINWLLLAIALGSAPALAAPSAQKPAAKKKLVLRQANTSSERLDAAFGKPIGAIQVEGLKRIEKDAVLSKIVSKPGELVSTEKAREDIKALFGMGFFDDIEIRSSPMEGGRVSLTYAFRERPVISRVEFEGNEQISTSDLKDLIKTKEWSIFDVNKVKDDVALVQKHYEDKGYFLAKVSFEVKPVKPAADGSSDEVELTYKINDFDKVEIKEITFLNNKRFSDRELKNILMETKEGGFLSFMNNGGNFKESSFKTDLQRLSYWYLDHGYIKFRYENPVVTVSDDKRYLFISIYVDEGETYTMGSVDYSGDLLYPKEQLSEGLKMTSGKGFSISQRNADIQKLTEMYQDLGFAFVNVIPKMNVKDEDRTVDIEYGFEKGSLVYFGEINVIGNTKTHDKVIRRELRIQEGELFSGSRLRISRENVERLGYFSPGEVIFNTVSPKGKNDVVDVEITIKERSTGTITLGAGYGGGGGAGAGFFFQSQISEINLFGKGQEVSLQAQYATDRKAQSFNLGFTDPYAFDTRWSMGADVYWTLTPITNRYQYRKLGFDVRLGHPIADYVNGYLTYKNEGLQISDIEDTSIPPGLIEADQGVLSSMTLSVVRDKRNNRFETSAGSFQRGSLEFAGLGGDKHFLKWTLNNRFYHQVVGDLVFRNSTETGHMYSLRGDTLPPSERFYLGGPNNMKGYEPFLLGPLYINSQGRRAPIGGVFQAYSLFELEHPIIREAGLKFVVFYDIGNTFAVFPDGNNEAFTLRQDVGLGFRWFSPIGPLRFEWGFPIGRKPGESSPVFTFYIGPPF